MDVAPTGDRGRVAKPVGGLPHGLDDGAPRGGRLGGTLGVPKRPVGEDRAGPCPGSPSRSHRPPRSCAGSRSRHPTRRRAPGRPAPTYWNSCWPGRSWQRRTSRPDAGHAGPDLVPGGRTCRGTGSGSRVPVDPGVAASEGRQPERPVEPRVLLVADPDEGRLEQADDGCQDLLARRARGAARSRSTWARMRGRTRAKSMSRANLSSSRRARQRAW